MTTALQAQQETLQSVALRPEYRTRGLAATLSCTAKASPLYWFGFEHDLPRQGAPHHCSHTQWLLQIATVHTQLQLFCWTRRAASNSSVSVRPPTPRHALPYSCTMYGSTRRSSPSGLSTCSQCPARGSTWCSNRPATALDPGPAPSAPPPAGAPVLPGRVPPSRAAASSLCCSSAGHRSERSPCTRNSAVEGGGRSSRCQYWVVLGAAGQGRRANRSAMGSARGQVRGRAILGAYWVVPGTRARGRGASTGMPCSGCLACLHDQVGSQ